MRAVFGVSDPGRRDALRDGLVAILAESASPAAIGLTIGPLRRLPHYRRFARHVARADELLAAEIAERRADPGLGERDGHPLDAGRRRVRRRLEDERRRAARPADDAAARRPRDDRDRRSPGPSTCCCTRRRRSSACSTSSDAGESEYLDAVVNESLRVRPVVPITGRLLHEPAELGGYRAPGRDDRARGDLHGSHQPANSTRTRSRSAPSASSTRRPTPTRGSRSAAAPAAASAPPSPSSRCASRCARSCAR